EHRNAITARHLAAFGGARRYAGARRPRPQRAAAAECRCRAARLAPPQRRFGARRGPARAGCGGLVFAARAGTAVDSVEAFVARHIARPACIGIRVKRIEMLLGPDDVDIAVRLAGLDRNPGWLPWLQREVRFVFEPHETGAGAG